MEASGTFTKCVECLPFMHTFIIMSFNGTVPTHCFHCLARLSFLMSAFATSPANICREWNFLALSTGFGRASSTATVSTATTISAATRFQLSFLGALSILNIINLCSVLHPVNMFCVETSNLAISMTLTKLHLAFFDDLWTDFIRGQTTD